MFYVQCLVQWSPVPGLVFLGYMVIQLISNNIIENAGKWPTCLSHVSKWKGVLVFLIKLGWVEMKGAGSCICYTKVMDAPVNVEVDLFRLWFPLFVNENNDNLCRKCTCRV